MFKKKCFICREKDKKYNMRRKYDTLIKLPCMWTRSYFASTAGNVSAETIQKYIQSQSKK